MPIPNMGGKRPAGLGITAGRLSPCPDKPNCVCSDAMDPRHAIAALNLLGPVEDAWPGVVRVVAAMPRTRVIHAEEGYLHAECRSRIFGFVDDLELHLRRDEDAIAVRSASRLGHGDLGVNRRRVERLRNALIAEGIVRGAGVL